MAKKIKVAPETTALTLSPGSVIHAMPDDHNMRFPLAPYSSRIFIVAEVADGKARAVLRNGVSCGEIVVEWFNIPVQHPALKNREGRYYYFDKSVPDCPQPPSLTDIPVSHELVRSMIRIEDKIVLRCKHHDLHGFISGVNRGERAPYYALGEGTSRVQLVREDRGDYQAEVAEFSARAIFKNNSVSMSFTDVAALPWYYDLVTGSWVTDISARLYHAHMHQKSGRGRMQVPIGTGVEVGDPVKIGDQKTVITNITESKVHSLTGGKRRMVEVTTVNVRDSPVTFSPKRLEWNAAERLWIFWPVPEQKEKKKQA